MNVYFISGMSANCKVFDDIELPQGFEKKYIEWLIPEENEPLDIYIRRMSAGIDISQPFVLVGYSLGGIIVQEMNKFLNPQKTIIIASMKTGDEVPTILRLGRRIRFANLPARFFKADNLVSDFFIRFIYDAKQEDLEKYVSYTDPVYTKWGLFHILNWDWSFICPRLYQIHGTKDQIFPLKGAKNADRIIEGGDHLLVIRKSEEVSKVLEEILKK